MTSPSHARRGLRHVALALDKLEREEAEVPDLVQAEDAHDVGVVQRGERPRVTLEAPQSLLVVG
jgi:hypothetical protein